jgi:hypothetical protein
VLLHGDYSLKQHLTTQDPPLVHAIEWAQSHNTFNSYLMNPAIIINKLFTQSSHSNNAIGPRAPSGR